MDPVSVAASIVGLITAASKVSEALIAFIRIVKDAPRLAHNVLGEVFDISASLGQLQHFLLGTGVSLRSHEDLLKIDQIRVVLSNCMMVFAELEKTVKPLKSYTPNLASRRLQWTWREQTIQRLLTRLKSSQESLMLMLTTMTL